MSAPEVFLISNFKTGLDDHLQPWLILRDAFTKLENGRVFKGVLEPRKGLELINKLQCLSTIATEVNAAGLPAVDITITANVVGPIYITDFSGVFQVQIDGSDNFTGDFTGATTFNRVTGAITFTWDDGGAATDDPTVQFQEACDEPVMGLFNFIESDGTRTLIAPNTKIVNKYDDANKVFVPLTFSVTSSITELTGDERNFFVATNYPDKAEAARLVMVNNVDVPIFYKLDAGSGNLTVFDYTDSTMGANPDYVAPAFGAIDKALHVFYFNERLVFLKPTLGGQTFGTAYLFSAIKDGSGAGDNFNSPGAGLQIIPDETPITGATLMGDRIIVYTEQNVWEITATQSFDLPFFHRRIEDSDYQMVASPYGTINWLRRAYGFGFWGIFSTDGRTSKRIDEKIPFFTRDDIQTDKIDIVNAGVVMESSELWWTYPGKDVVNAVDFSDSIIAFNYENASWSKYDLALTTLGGYKNTNLIPWSAVNENFGGGGIHPEWEEWATTDDRWDSFFWQAGAFKSIGGDKDGHVFWLEEGNDDHCVQITGITNANGAVVTLTEQIFEENDQILIDGVVSASLDMEGIINGKKFDITAVSGLTITINLDTSDVSAWSSGGYVCELFNFLAQTKALNPFADKNKQCRMHKIWFFIETSSDDYLLDFFVDRREDPYRTDVVINAGNTQGGTVKKWVPVTVNQTGSFHTVRIRQKAIVNPGKVHALLLQCSPTGRIF